MVAEPKNAMMRFLLGEMSGQERADFEEAYIKDSDLFQQLVELENDLIDLYAMGALTQPERERMEQSFLADPEGRKRLEFAQTWAGHPGLGQPGFSDGPLRPTIRSQSLRSVHSAWRSIAAVAVIAMLAAILSLLRANHNLRLALEESQKQEIAARQTAETLERQLNHPGKESAAGSQLDKGAAAVPPDQTLLALTLKDDSLRANGQIPKLSVSSKVSSVALHLVFPADTFADYDVFVETANGAPVWRRDHVKSRSADDGTRVIVAVLPARLLRTEDYTVRITGSSSGATEDVAGYSFSVIRR